MKVVLSSTIKQDNEVCNGISINLSNASSVQKKNQMKNRNLGGMLNPSKIMAVF